MSRTIYDDSSISIVELHGDRQEDSSAGPDGQDLLCFTITTVEEHSAKCTAADASESMKLSESL